MVLVGATTKPRTNGVDLYPSLFEVDAAGRIQRTGNRIAIPLFSGFFTYDELGLRDAADDAALRNQQAAERMRGRRPNQAEQEIKEGDVQFPRHFALRQRFTYVSDGPRGARTEDLTPHALPPADEAIVLPTDGPDALNTARIGGGDVRGKAQERVRRTYELADHRERLVQRVESLDRSVDLRDKEIRRQERENRRHLAKIAQKKSRIQQLRTQLADWQANHEQALATVRERDALIAQLNEEAQASERNFSKQLAIATRQQEAVGEFSRETVAELTALREELAQLKSLEVSMSRERDVALRKGQDAQTQLNDIRAQIDQLHVDYRAQRKTLTAELAAKDEEMRTLERRLLTGALSEAAFRKRVTALEEQVKEGNTQLHALVAARDEANRLAGAANERAEKLQGELADAKVANDEHETARRALQLEHEALHTKFDDLGIAHKGAIARHELEHSRPLKEHQAQLQGVESAQIQKLEEQLEAARSRIEELENQGAGADEPLDPVTSFLDEADAAFLDEADDIDLAGAGAVREQTEALQTELAQARDQLQLLKKDHQELLQQEAARVQRELAEAARVEREPELRAAPVDEPMRPAERRQVAQARQRPEQAELEDQRRASVKRTQPSSSDPPLEPGARPKKRFLAQPKQAGLERLRERALAQPKQAGLEPKDQEVAVSTKRKRPGSSREVPYKKRPRSREDVELKDAEASDEQEDELVAELRKRVGGVDPGVLRIYAHHELTRSGQQTTAQDVLNGLRRQLETGEAKSFIQGAVEEINRESVAAFEQRVQQIRGAAAHDERAKEEARVEAPRGLG